MVIGHIIKLVANVALPFVSPKYRPAVTAVATIAGGVVSALQMGGI